MPKIEMSKEDMKLVLLFKSEHGKIVLEYLKRVFFNDSVYEKGDPYHTSYRAGQQDVIGFIIEAIENSKGVDSEKSN